MTKYFVSLHWLFVVTVLLLTGNIIAQEPLTWKLTEDQQLRYDIIKIVTLSLPDGGKEFTLRQQFELTWTVQSVDDNGNAEIEQSIDRIQLSLDDPLGELEYDSAKDEDPGGVAALAGQLFRTLRDHPLRFKLAPKGEISELVVPEEILETMRNSSFESPLTEFTSEGGIQGLLLQGIPELSEEPVSVGDTWTRIAEPIGPQAVECEYQYQGENDASLSRITSTRMVSIKETAVDQPSIEEQESSGEILFDGERGLLVKNQWTVKLRLNFPNGDESHEGTLDQSFKMALVTKGMD